LIPALENVWALVEAFTKKPQHVKIDEEAIERLVPNFKDITVPQEKLPACVKSVPDLLLYELYASSVNYCYWYGSSDVRPLDCNAHIMYRCLDEAAGDRSLFDIPAYSVTQKFKELMSLRRFPLIEERARHLRETDAYAKRAVTYILEEGVEAGLEKIIAWFPGLASDMFLKRAALFFMQVRRRSAALGKPLFDDALQLPAPADYQLPKMLRFYGVLKYGPMLTMDIDNDVLIPSGSRKECEIRASMILACKKLSQKSGIDISTLDYWLWLNRKLCTDKFHLTITTDY
jgi:hypothetical protein